MRRPTPADVSLLAQPTWDNVAKGALYTWGILPLAVGVIVVGAIAPSGRQTPAMVPVIFLFAVLMAAVVSGVIIGTWGILSGLLIGRLLKPIPWWGVHAVVHFVWGTATGLLVVLIYLLATSGEANPFAPPIWATSVALIAATGVSTLAGWALAWRAAIRRSATEEPALPLLAE
ncbi:MAG: hypothetical protein JWR04_1097 [Rhodoglobus sp.]|nr:hypothetical protein [Rhodoglobus sp.]